MSWIFRGILIVSLIVTTKVKAQVGQWVKRTVNNIFNDTVSSYKPKFIAYPTLVYSPETRWEIGVIGLYVYYANRDTINRLSEITATTFVTQERQYGLWMDHALYSDKSKWFSLGRLRFQRFPLLYYGIGPNSPKEEIARVDADNIAIRERILRQVIGNFYVGLETDYQYLTNVNFNVFDLDTPDLLPLGAQGSSNLGLGVGLVYDNRHNVLNVRKGVFAETGFLKYDKGWGSDFSFTQYFVDARYFYPVTKNQVLAYQVYGIYQQGEVPFNQLALMGGESIMRGYYLGRFRDKTLLATQAEYRFLPFGFSKRWGAAAFISTGTVTPELYKIDLKNWKVAGGAGVRFLIFPAKDIFTRIDLALTQEGIGYYFFVGEAF